MERTFPEALVRQRLWNWTGRSRQRCSMFTVRVAARTVVATRTVAKPMMANFRFMVSVGVVGRDRGADYAIALNGVRRRGGQRTPVAERGDTYGVRVPRGKIAGFLDPIGAAL